jgi:protein-disulfide isomerase
VSKKQLLILIGLFLAVAAALGAWLVFANQDPAIPTANAGFEISPQDRTMGNPKAKVVLIEYGALTCPWCARFNNEIFPELKKNYIDTGKVFYVYRMYARLPEDVPAQKTAACLKGRYFDMVDLLYRNQPLWDPENGITDTHGGLVRVGRMAGLAPEQVDACINDPAEETHLAQIKAEAQSRYNLPYFPYFLINGAGIDWKGGYPEFAALLDQALAAP